MSRHEYVELSKDTMESILYNKELCDTIRDIVKNSPTNLADAYVCLETSDDYKRDSFMIKSLSKKGFNQSDIRKTVQSLSGNNTVECITSKSVFDNLVNQESEIPVADAIYCLANEIQELKERLK